MRHPLAILALVFAAASLTLLAASLTLLAASQMVPTARGAGVILPLLMIALVIRALTGNRP